LAAPAALPELAGGDEPTRFSADQHSSTRGMGSTHAPQGGILPEIQATGYESSGVPHIEDRGVYHAADAMKGLYDMGDAPSCHTCGAIMVRNGSCYRCMSCGSTSGCS
jgi:ribonucleoside-diphosphate reductase alpha chain